MTLRLPALLAVLALLIALPCAASDDALWQIGQNDNSYSEFAIRDNLNAYTRVFADGVRFEMGKSSLDRNWPFIQPGPVDAWAGGRQHKQEIVFDLDAQPEGLFTLDVDLVDVHSSHAPVFEVHVNDLRQRFRLSQGVSDASLSNPANGRPQNIRMYVRGSALHKGRNTVTLTIIEGSWALYDCVSMNRSSSAPKALENLSLQPSCLFKRSGGKLKQVVMASVDCFEDPGVVQAEVTGDGGLRTQQAFTDVFAGRPMLEVEVPEVSQPQKVHVKLSAGKAVVEADCQVVPQKHWKIYMMPSAHLDIGYTARQDRTMDTHRKNLERALGWCAEYPDFMWDLEGSLIAEDFIEKSPNAARLIELAKKGKVGVMGLFGNELTGICSSEGLTRLIDYYDELRNAYGIESMCAMQSDVPTMVATVPMILAEHGIKYLSHGVNAARARPDQDLYNTPHYWESPDGSKVLLWRTPGYGHSGAITGYGDVVDIDFAKGRIDAQVRGYASRDDYPFDAILMHGGYSDNQPNGKAMAALPAEWNRKYEYPKIVFTKGPEFFEYIERNYADKLTTAKGDAGGWWEDGAGSSTRETAITRVAKEQLLSAEKLSVLCDDKAREAISADVQKAWWNVLMYDEHTWGAAQSISGPDSKETREQWAIKKAFADKAAELADKALGSATDSFAAQLGLSDDAVVVFNPSSWERSEWVTLPASGRRVFAQSVPAMGYKVLESVPDEPKAAPVTKDGVLDNRFYTLSFDARTGAVKSIYDKELQRELIDSSSYGANQYLYASGGENERVMNFDTKQPVADIAVASCQDAKLVESVQAGAQVMDITCTAPMASSFRSQVILYDGQKRIDFINEVDKNPNLAKEAGYFAFPFAFKNPAMRLEIPDGVIRPEVDQLRAACRDWYCVQHFLTVSDDSAAVVWSAIDTPLVTLQDINRGQWYDKLDIANGNVFAYVFNNYWWTNYKATQSGPLTMRFAMTSAKSVDDVQAKRFGESVQSPMLCKAVKGGSGASKTAPRSFVAVGDESVVLQAMKPARFADGTVVRLREMAGKSITTKLTVDGITFKGAYLCNLAEDKLSKLPVREGAVEVPCRALGLATVLLER